MTSATYTVLMQQVYFSIYNFVKDLHFVETPAKVDQNSGILCYLHVMLMVVKNYNHLLLANKQVHAALRC